VEKSSLTSFLTIKKSGLGWIYSIVLLFAGMILSGGGHYYLFLMLGVSPYGLGFFFWPIISALLLNTKKFWGGFLIVGLLILHYLGIIFYSMNATEWDQHFISNLSSYLFPENLGFINWISYVTIAVYLFGQILIWYKVLGNLLHRK
jgi:hypothetical protein